MITELEKPVSEDAMAVAKQVYAVPMMDCGEWLEIADGIIQQYAESFAAKKCARVRVETLEEARRLFHDTPVHKYTMYLGRLIDAAKKEAGE